MASCCAKESGSLEETSEAWAMGQRGAGTATLRGQGIPGAAAQTAVKQVSLNMSFYSKGSK